MSGAIVAVRALWQKGWPEILKSKKESLMDRSCPRCKADVIGLVKKSMRERAVLIGVIRDFQRINRCPACKVKLYTTPHPIDRYVQLSLFIPIFIFISGLYNDSSSLKIVSYLVFVAIGLAVVFIINLPSYRKWRYFHLYE